MNKFTVGVIGVGFVGGAITRGFSLYSDVKFYDSNPKRSGHSLEDVCKQEFVFVCLPTPMQGLNNGETDLSILHEMFSKFSGLGSTNTIFIIKSTVPIGTTEIFKKKYNINIIHNPEFLTARNADNDFISPARTILGGESGLTNRVAELFKYRFPGNNILLMSSNESEAVKYMANCFFAVKVMFFNEMFLGLKDYYNLDWNKVLSGVLTDGRVGNSHCQVPGHDGKFGFGGICFPKDIASLIEQIKVTGFNPLMLDACWTQNKIIRPEMDWADLSGAVSKVKSG